MPGPAGKNESERRALAALLALLLALYLVQIHHGLPNRDIVWGYDANPLLPLIAAKKIFLDGWNTGWHTQYPPFHYFVLLLVLAPYMAVQWLLGNLAGLRMEGGYPYGLKDFDTLFTHVAVITRLVSAAMALGTVYWVYRTGRALHSSRAGLLAACIIGFSPAVVYYVHTETVDVPGLFWMSGALYCYVRALQGAELRHYLGLAVLAAAATATSHYAYGAFALLPLPLVAAFARRRYGSIAPRSLALSALDRRHVLALLTFVAAYAVAQNWAWNFSGYTGQLKLALSLAPADPDYVYLHTGPSSRLPRSPWSLLSLGFVLGWVGFATCLAGLWYALARERTIAGLLAWPVAGCAVFSIWPALAVVSFFERPFLPLALMLAVPGGVLLARLTASRKPGAGLLAAGAVAAMGLNGFAMDAALMDDPRYRAERYLREHAGAGARIELYGLRSELPRVQPGWDSTVLNILPQPASDLRLTEEFFSPEALARRAPDFIVVSQAFVGAYAADHPPGVRHAIHEFLRSLHRGELPYERTGYDVPGITAWFGFPPRLTPAVTIYSRSSRTGATHPEARP